MHPWTFNKLGSVVLLLCALALFTTRMQAQQSPHGRLKIPCTDCHTTDSWKVLASPMTFNHATTAFALKGQHTTVPCIGCHTTKKFAGTPTNCYDCHQQDFNKSLMPNHRLGKLSHDCTTCHTMTSWTPSVFQHSKTNFQLVGAHLTVDCASCHINNRFAGLPGDCFSCHQQVYNQTTTPNHRTSQLSHDCTTCHTTTVWKPATFDHAKTMFPLVGAHATTDCASCHKNGQYKNVSTECFSCHQTDFTKSVTANHVTGQFSHDCTTCHSMNAWKPALFDHAKSNFPLVGAHATTDCASCHKNGQFTTLSTDCFSCHQADFTKSTTTNHVTGQFSHDCTTCHSMLVWKPATFDHAKTVFPLVGAHATTDCASCHKNGQYKNIATDCYTCHAADFAKSTTTNHVTGQFSHDCTTCHSMLVWKPATFDHAKTVFPLVGAHATTDCASCHKNGQYANLPTDCYSCHQTDFTKSITANHVTGQFSHDCTTCHSMLVWKPATFDHAKTMFPLVGTHLTTPCASCHSNGQFKTLSTDCYSCHQTDFAKSTTTNHVTGQFSHDCTTCHSMIAWLPSTFSHAKTTFPLVGTHVTTPCASCHKNGQYTNVSTDCYSCHQTDFAKSTTTNHVTNAFSHDCTTCHSMTAWLPSTFSHAKTIFPLVGTHVTTPCASCHKNGQYANVSTDCYSCHQTDFAKSTTTNHVTGQFSHDCTTCHSMIAWLPATFDHAKTTFPLVGTHVTTPCASCHKNGQYANLPTDCYTCHQTDFAKSTTTNHVTNQFSHDCTTCHSMIAWLPSTFSHAKTTFPLVGTHVTTPCASCHKNGQYANLSTDCYTCHQTDFAKSTTTPHVTNQFSHDCTTCHSMIAWLPATFDHSKTTFPLVGTHVTTPCASCHKNGQFQGLATDCYSCHSADFAKSTTTPHVTNQFSHDCTTCHSMIAWLPSTFSHAKTTFPLVGTHVTTPCASCHKNGQYANLPTDCYTCHQADFTKSTTTNHVTNQFSHDCTTCHSMIAWLPATFDHSKTTFPLVGTHVTTPCASCHKNGQFQGLATDCYSCHSADFAKSTTTPHVTNQFSHDCTTCHSMTAWLPSTFNHSTTVFPLTGTHATTACIFCHKSGVYKGTPTDCYTCHTTDFTGVTDPNHVTGQFDHNCATCHSTTAWSPATFDHSKSAFPLTGAHATVACASCHTSGKFVGLTTDCYTCHTADYTGAKSPDHVAGAFYPGTACTTCHNTTAWQPWIFGHNTYYAISKHHGSSVTCQKCHTTPGNLAFASCTTGCHTTAHNQTKTCYLGSNCHAGSSN